MNIFQMLIRAFCNPWEEKAKEIHELNDRALYALFMQARREIWRRNEAEAARIDAEAQAAALAESEAHPS